MTLLPEHEEEFDVDARARAEQLVDSGLSGRIAAACRGSANPAALAWLAEELGIEIDSKVVDLGGGLGGPAAWIERRYLCRVVVLDPAAGACDGARRLFRLAVVRGDAADPPFRRGSFDCSLFLGTISVLSDPARAIAAAAELSGRLGVLDYCSVTEKPVHAGGSTFLSESALLELVERCGWTLGHHGPLTLPTPQTWSEASVPGEPSESEHEVADAIRNGEIAPVVLIAVRKVSRSSDRGMAAP